jgi:hypothetical protein
MVWPAWDARMDSSAIDECSRYIWCIRRLAVGHRLDSFSVGVQAACRCSGAGGGGQFRHWVVQALQFTAVYQTGFRAASPPSHPVSPGARSSRPLPLALCPIAVRMWLPLR